MTKREIALLILLLSPIPDFIVVYLKDWYKDKRKKKEKGE